MGYIAKSSLNAFVDEAEENNELRTKKDHKREERLRRIKLKKRSKEK